MWCFERSPGARRLGRRLFLAGLTAGIAGLTQGCFRPMLAEDTASGALIGRIGFPDFNDRFGYHLDRSLRDRLGETRVTDYRLTIRTDLKRDDLAITQDNAITRISLTAEATWALYRDGETEPVLRDRVVAQSGYNSTASLFATREARRDIERRLARDLGERIARRVLAQADQIGKAQS